MAPDDESTHSVPEALIALVENNLTPVFEAGSGIRKRLLQEGWRANEADAIASRSIMLMLDLISRALRASKP